MPSPIDISLLAHILLDSESSGRFGVQGNTFNNTFNYLNEYFKTLPSDRYDEIRSFAESMDALVGTEQEIRSSYSKNDVEYLAGRIGRTIIDLPLNKKYLIPGGWQGIDAPGHAMIYEFEHTNEGLCFSIYNSGAGIQYHEKTSSTEKELFSPVKTYLLSSTRDITELNQFIKRLIVPQLTPKHPARNERKFDPDILYREIDFGLAFIKAKLVPQDLSQPHLTTASQLSSTCTQRSIHQMLKVILGDLPTYQRLIFDFKMHALNDYLQTHPKPRSEKITLFINRGIINNLRILQKENIFSTPEEQKKTIQQLKALQDELKKSTYMVDSPKDQIIIPSHSIQPFNYPLESKGAAFKAPTTQLKTATSNEPRHLPLNPDTLLPDLDAFIQECSTRQTSNPLWVMDQIDQLMLKLPIPESCQQEKPYYLTIDFYHTITTAEQFEKIEKNLDVLQDLYVNACSSVLKSSTIPSQFITEHSFFILRDYFDVKGEDITGKPYSHSVSSISMQLENIMESPFLATNHLAFDTRMKQILNGFSTRLNHAISQEQYYASLLERHPKLLKQLSDEYDKLHGNNQSSFHQSLRKKNLNALYILLNKLDNNYQLTPANKGLKDNNPDVEQIIKQLIRQHALKKFFTQGNYLLSGNEERVLPLKIEKEKYTDRACLNSPYLSIWMGQISDKKSLTAHKYNLPPSPSLNALLQNHISFPGHGPDNENNVMFRSYQNPNFGTSQLYRRIQLNSNQIQLVSHNTSKEKQIIGKEDYFNRDLFHLRRVPEQQIKLTLDYFSKTEYISKLNDPNVQLYVEANLFQPGWLCTALRDDPAFFNRFETFVEKGLNYFAEPDKLLNQPLVFFVRMRILIHNYAILGSIKHPESNRLPNDEAWLTKLIEQNHDMEILSTLHTLRFFNILTQYQLAPNQENTDLLSHGLTSWFYMQSTQIPPDTTSAAAQQRAGLDFKVWLQAADSSLVQSSVEPIMRGLLPELNDVELIINEKQHSIYEVINTATNQLYAFDAEQGKIFQNGQSFGPIPLEFKLHPVMHQLGLKNASTCILHEDGQTISFTHPSHMRIKKENGQFIVQKEWSPGQWYQLTALTNEQKSHFKLSTTYIEKNNLPVTLTDINTEAWVGDTTSLIVQNGKPIYKVDQQGNFHVLDEQGNQTDSILVSQATAFLPLIARFESSEFYRLNLDESQHEQGTINFPRYGFSLAISGEKITIPGTNYTLVPSEDCVFPSEIAALQFRDDAEEQCIVPIQPFYCNPDLEQTAGHYYRLTHDISGRIPKYELMKETQRHGSLPPLWSHNNSARSITYKLINGKPAPEKAADALYLCYLYLASHEIDKAWAVLNDIPQRFALTGSMDEITYLSWMVEALPTILTKTDERGLTHETPEYVACQLKALALYSEFLSLNEKPVFITDQEIDKSCKNGHYESICLANLKNFYRTLPSKIHTLYSRYQQGARHLDEAYTLHDNECISLLNYCFPKSSDPNEKRVIPGSLGYEQCRLDLNRLLNEYRRLEAMGDNAEKEKQSFPTDLIQRIVDIRQYITKENSIAKKQTQLEKISIDLVLQGSIDLKLLSQQAQDKVNNWSRMGLKASSKPIDAMSMLHSGIEQDDFIMHFPTLVDIARAGTLEQKKQLNEFCMTYLGGVRHGESDGRRKNIHLLTNILYRIVNNADKFPEAIPEEPLTLYKLIEVASNWEIPPIEVLQPKDVYAGMMADTQTIWDELESITPLASPMPKIEPIHTKSLMHLLGVEKHCKSYRQEEINYHTAIDDLLKSIKNTSDPVILQKAEEKAGQLKFDCIQAQRNIAEDILKSKKIRTDLKKGAKTLHNEHEANLGILWNNVTRLANKIIYTPSSSRHDEWFAGRRHVLTKKELLTFYLQADRAIYIEKTGLSPDECDSLHRLIHESVTLEIQQQHTARLLKALAQTDRSNEPQASLLHQIASVLITENVHQAQTDPGLMLFQYTEDLLVNPRQADVLHSLLSSPNDPQHVKNVVEKVIMGGGKSKVILPMIAAKKVNGLNFVVVEVPRALLATNHADLNNTSQRVFGQKARRFEFNRDSDCSPERLQSIYQTFNNIMTNQEYLVTTGESMQSLELKCLELLLDRPDDLRDQKQWEKQVYWANKIILFIKQRGEVIIDEVHQGLLLKKKLNYTIGHPRPIENVIIQHAISLYQFTTLLGHTPTIDDLLSNANSPLNDCLYTLNSQTSSEQDIREQLKSWFNNQSMPTVFDQAPSDVKNILAFYKEQLTLLPQTSSRHYKEHYGPSEIQSNVLKRKLALPYAASNRPNEHSRFGNALETINYTIQSLLAEGLDEMLLKESLDRWQAAARSEHLSGQYATLNNTPTGQSVNLLLKNTGFTLQTINLRETNHLTMLCKKLQNNQMFLYSVLKEHILPQITIEPELLHSDAYGHVDMYRTVQGISGTPWNHSTYHQRLSCNQHASLGSDGFIQTLLQKKSTSFNQLKFEKADLFLKQSLENKDNVRAIIDICAMFAGISNLDVAKQLASCATNQNQPKPVRYILYFNQDEVLCALNVASPNKPIILATSDPVKIDQMLGCTPEERLTYYDQSHTVGTDIKQGSTAHALVLADTKTHLQSFLQGCMRMRGLAEQQTVSVIVPDGKATTLDDFIALMAKNELDQLKQDNFFAALGKMNNVIRDDLLQRILSIPEKDYEIKHKMMLRFRDHFVETKPTTLFEQYGSIHELQDTDKILQDHADALLVDWETRVVDSTDKGIIKANLSAIITQSIPYCHPKSIRCTNNMNQETEQQQEKMQEMLTEMEMMLESESFGSTLMPQQRMQADILLSSLNNFQKEGIAVGISSLNAACGSHCNHFSEHLLVHDHYAQVYKGQKQMLCEYVKPSIAILFRQSGEDITACLIDIEDVPIFQTHISNEKQDPHIWISTTQHTCLAGERPNNLLENVQYQSLIEQIRLFNGECVTLNEQLSEQKKPSQWLNPEKLVWFREHIGPYRQTKSSEFNRLQMTLSATINLEIQASNDKKINSINKVKQLKTDLHAFKASGNSPSPNVFSTKK